ncbi:autophagy-related protein 27 domain-containing protein [Phthorimaea operculella]|nr:autophagy-related protein 27 domain-containing protein [Phthorimaea operculella]
MDAFNYLLCFVILSLSVLSSSTNADDVCVQKTACSCEFANGTGIDLKNSAGSSFITTQMYEAEKNGSGMDYKLSTYYFHPCFDVKPVVNGTMPPENKCNNALGIYRTANRMTLVNATTNSYQFIQEPCEWLGDSTQIVFSNDGRAITYRNGPSNTTVLLVCAQSEDKLQVESTAEPNNIILNFYTRNACPLQLESAGRSTGSTLLIVFFSCVIFYLVLGVCTKKFLMGATGVEVVPNLAFWSDLPNLVKDGWAFMVSGFKLPARAGPAASPDPNSYDSI